MSHQIEHQQVRNKEERPSGRLFCLGATGLQGEKLESGMG